MSSDGKKIKKGRAVKKASSGPFDRINRKIYRTVRDGAVGTYLSSYDRTCEAFRRSYFVRRFAHSQKKRALEDESEIRHEKMPDELAYLGIVDTETLPRTRLDRFSEAFDNSAIVGLMRRFKDLILYTSVVSYGVLLFGFALFMLTVQTAQLFLSLYELPFLLPWQSATDTASIVIYMVVAVVLMAVSLLLIFVKERSLYHYMSDSAISGFILRHFLGVRSEALENKIRNRHNGRAFVIGMVLGLLTFFIQPQRFFVLLAILICSSLIINIPEFGLVSLIFALPFLSFFEHPTLVAVGLSGLILLSTLLKLLRRKRFLRIEPADLFAILFLLLTFLGGILTIGGRDSFYSALVFTLLGLVYFAVTVLVTNSDWLKRCFNALMMSSCVVSLVGIMEWIFQKQSDIWQDKAVFATLSGRVVSMWGNPNVLAEYLIVTLFISFGCLVGRKKMTMRSLAFFSFLLSAACLVLTWSRGAWVAVALTFILMLLMLSHKSVPWVLLLVAELVVVFFFLPEAFVERIVSIVSFSDSSVIYRMNIWKGCAALVRKCFLTGIGVGEAAFSKAYVGFSLVGIESAPHAHNLFLQIMIEHGIMGVVLFIALILMLIRSACTLFRARSFESFSAVSALSLTSATIALLINGMTDYIWYNNRIYLLFWIVLGLITATWRVGMTRTEIPMRELDACDVSFQLSGRQSRRKTKKTK